MVFRSHDPSVDVLPHRSEKIRKQSLSPQRKAHHDLPCVFVPVRNDSMFVSILSKSESSANVSNFFTFRPVDAWRHSRNLLSLGP
jgi:hypothetical protein